jgi:hypothetical protein
VRRGWGRIIFMMRSILREKGKIGPGGSIPILGTMNTTCSDSDESEDDSLIGSGRIHGPFLQGLWSQIFRFDKLRKKTTNIYLFVQIEDFIAMLRHFPKPKFLQF